MAKEPKELKKSGTIHVTFHGYESEEAITAAIKATFQPEAAQILFAHRETRSNPNHPICTCDYSDIFGHPT